MINAAPKYKPFSRYFYKSIYISYCFLSYSNAFVSNLSPSEDSQSSSGTDLNIVNTEDEMHIDMANWTLTKWKRL